MENILRMAKRDKVIRNLKRNGKSGWRWEEFNPDADIRGHPKWTIYHTNQNGEGLWKEGRQIIGNTQFELSKKKENAYSKIYPKHKKEFWHHY